MKNSDGSVSCDNWDIRAIFAVMKKFNASNLNLDMEEINITREYMTKSVLRKIWYIIKYPFPRKGETLYLMESIKK